MGSKMKMVHATVTLDNVTTVKRVQVPEDIVKDSVKACEYIRNFYTEFGYQVSGSIRIH